MATRNMKKVIECACSHNHGRSPLAEAFARKRLAQVGALDFEVISTGTEVARADGMLAGTVDCPAEWYDIIVDINQKRGIYDAQTADALRAVMKPENFGPDQKRYVNEAMRLSLVRFFDEEHEHRAEAFRKFDLGEPKQTRDETKAREDVVLFLGMGPDHTEFTEGLYKTRVHTPIIQTLSGYATRLPGLKFKNSYGGTSQEYLEMAEVIRDLTFKSVDRAVQEIK